MGEATANGVDSATDRADAAWPAWARRSFPVDALGAPGTFAAWMAICLAFVVIAFVGIWNAEVYPVPLGYDAQGHVDYAHVLLTKHHLPTAAESNEAGQPPGYYLLAGSAARLGHDVFGWHEDKPYTQMPEISYRGAQYLNVAFVLATAVILLALARIVAPERPAVWAGALLFFAFLPVVSKTAAMFHPETLNMLLSTFAIWLATTIAQRRHLRLGRATLLVATLGIGLLVRSSVIFTLIAAVVGLAVLGLTSARRRTLPWRRIGAIGTVAAVLLGGWLVIHPTTSLLGADLTHSIFHPGSRTANVGRARFTDLTITTILQAPWRPNYVNAALPETYTEIWGDWIGVFAWSPYSVVPWEPTQRVLKDQSWIGVLPTAMAIAGWLVLLALAVVRRRDLLALALLPGIAVVGYLYRSYQFLSSDGDLLKASYLLTTAPVWALGFGLAYASVGRFRRIQGTAALCLLVFAILELRFMLYGLRDHHVIF